jgi:CRP-like cAMP-binding protein
MTTEETYVLDLHRLSHAALFANLDEDDIERILTILPSETVIYNKGDVLAMQGERLQKIGLILEGAVKTSKVYVEGDDDTTRRYGVLEVMGLIVAISNTQISTYMFCAEHDSTVILWIQWPHINNPATDKLPVPLYKRYITNCFAIAADITIITSTRAESSVQPSVRKKIHRFFHEMAEMPHSVVATTDTTVTFILDMTQEQLAEFLGISRPKLLIALSDMEKNGMIRRKKFNSKTYYTINKNQ